VPSFTVLSHVRLHYTIFISPPCLIRAFSCALILEQDITTCELTVEWVEFRNAVGMNEKCKEDTQKENNNVDQS
jgi:hypothetical protein